MTWGNPREPRGSKITSSHSAEAVGYHRCPGCNNWSRCTCDSDDTIDIPRKKKGDVGFGWFTEGPKVDPYTRVKYNGKKS